MPDQRIIKGNNTIDNARIGLVASRFNSFIVDRLQTACLQQLEAAGVSGENIIVVQVPGAFEIPQATARLIKTQHCDAVITLGAIIRGETPHFEYIARECAHGIGRVALRYDTPVIFGVLTVDNADQAMDRAGGEESNKGAEAAQAAIEIISVMRKMGS